MKHLKMLSFAAMSALGLMAIIGAGAASATTLSTDAAGAVKYTAGTEIHWTLKSETSLEIKTTGGSLIATCTETTIKGTMTTATGTSVGGPITALTAGGCSQTTDTISLGSLSIKKGTGDSGTVSSSGTAVTFGVFGVSCTYGTGEGTTLGTITGGKAPELAINAAEAKSAGGFLCPNSTFITTTMVVTSPHALHFVE